MILSPPLKKMLKEFHRHAAPALDELFKEFEKDANERALIGATSDETLQRVYKRQGSLDTIQELRSFLQNL